MLPVILLFATEKEPLSVNLALGCIKVWHIWSIWNKEALLTASEFLVPILWW